MVSQFFFRTFGPQFGLKIKRGGPPGLSPGSATAEYQRLIVIAKGKSEVKRVNS